MTPPFEVLLTRLPTACVHVGGDGLVTWINWRAREVLGEVVGVPVEQVIAPLDSLREAAHGQGRRQFRRTHPRPIEYGFQVTDLGDGLIVVFQDITGFERLREERDQLMQLAAVGDLLPAVLHELKNPLAGVRTTLELLVEEHPGDELGLQLQALLNQTRRMGLILDGLGRLRQTLQGERLTAIDACVREAVDVLRAQAVDRGIALERRIDPLPLLAFDAAAMRALVFNLVTNALHACRSNDHVLVSLARDAGHLVLQVRDSGQGMSAEVRAKCTDLFFTTRPQAAGIGLALVSNLTASAHGQLTIDSHPGQGTAVTVRLPLPAAR